MSWAPLLVLTVLPIVAGPAFAGVASGTVGGAHTCCYMLAGVQETRVHTLSSKVPCGDRASISSTSRLLLHPMLPEANGSCHSAKERSSLPSRSQETDWGNMEGSHPRPGEGGMQGCRSWLFQTHGQWELLMDSFSTSPPTRSKGDQ